MPRHAGPSQARTDSLMHPNLSFDQAPPISVPLRFFLGAPLWGMAAGLLLLFAGTEIFAASRWSAAALALTHLITVGFMLQAMAGALLQFIPVAAGGNIWRPRLIAGLVHVVLLLAAAALVSGLLWQLAWALQLAVLLFLLGLIPYLITVAWALISTPAQSASLNGLRLAVLGLGVTLLLGALIATQLGWAPAWAVALPFVELVNTHATWGLAGWALMLLIAVSYQVVPMFQITPNYPARYARWLPLGLLSTLLLWSLRLFAIDKPTVQLAAQGVFGLGLMLAASYALMTLWLQRQRRRKLTDVTFAYWRLAMLSLLLLVLGWLPLLFAPWLGAQYPGYSLGLGGLALAGIFMSAICGMLYKIVPFIIWLHLQRLGNLKTLPPNMKQIMPEAAMRGQFRLHVTSLGLLLASAAWPVLAPLAGLALLASMLWLEWNLVLAVRLYLDYKRRTQASMAAELKAMGPDGAR